jgi:hypothetical protein
MSQPKPPAETAPTTTTTETADGEMSEDALEQVTGGANVGSLNVAAQKVVKLNAGIKDPAAIKATLKSGL